MRFVVDFHRLQEEWASWAASQVAAWEHADGRDWDGALAVMADIARDAGRHDREGFSA
jgi:hypothetical protein